MKEVLQHHEVRRAIRFGIIGVLNTAIDFAIFAVLHGIFHVGYLEANVVAFFTASINSYFFNRRWTFRSTAVDIHRELLQYVAVLAIGFFLNEGALYILVSRFGILPIFGKVGATVLSLSWNFMANRFWTFKSVVQAELADRS